MATFQSNTPSKSYFRIQYTPTTKKRICILCGKREENDSYRVRLFKSEKKSEACELVEKLLSIEISPVLHTDSICRNCHKSLLTLKTKLIYHKTNYEKTIQNLKHTHGKTSKKRLPFEEPDSTHEAKESRRESSNPLPLCESMVEDKNEKKNSKVTLSFGTEAEIYNLSQTQEEIIRHVLDGRVKEFCESVLKQTELREALENITADKIQTEIKELCMQNQLPVLSSKTEESLRAVSWEYLSTEFERRTPNFWKFLVSSSTNQRQMNRNVRKTKQSIIPGLVSAACKLVSLYNGHMNVVQHLNSLILLKGGAKKSVFRRLNATNDCLGYAASLSMADDFSKLWACDLHKWSTEVCEDAKVEKQISHRIKALKEETNAIGDDVLPSVTVMFELAEAEAELVKHRNSMHPGFYFVGDNVDMRTKVRQMTLGNQNKDQHMFQICAYKNRVSGNHLDNTRPKDDINTVQFKQLVPGQEDHVKLTKEFAFLVAAQLTELIPCFNLYNPVLPKYIEHQYLKETMKKSERINMGVLQKNEQFNEDMTDICSFLHQYVPGSSDDEDWQKNPEKTLSGGDYLTFERHKQAQSAKRNGRTPSKRLEGLVPKMEEFHNQAEFLQVIWKILYTTASSKDTGTLYAARNSINAKNVTKDPASNYYASSELVDKFTKAFIVTAAMDHFGMDSLEATPTQNNNYGAIGDQKQMKDYILSEAMTIVKKCTATDFPSIPEVGYQSNNDIICATCGKKYKLISSLRNHEDTSSCRIADKIVSKKKVKKNTWRETRQF